MKPKDIVHEFEIRLDFKTNKVTQKCTKYTVLGVNEDRLVINNRYFTVIFYKKPYRGSSEKLFNEVEVIDTSNWNTSEYYDYIEGKLYTSTSNYKIAYRRIKKELEKYINKKHGRYCNAITILDQIQI